MALEKAMRLMPNRTDIPFWLMSLCARRGEQERAQRIFDESLAKRCPPDQLASAHEILLRGQMRESHLLVDQGRTSEALESLDKLLERTVDPKGREIVQNQIETVREIQRFNEAMQFVMKKDYDRAAKLLEDLLLTAKDPDVRQHAEKELDSLRSRRK